MAVHPPIVDNLKLSNTNRLLGDFFEILSGIPDKNIATPLNEHDCHKNFKGKQIKSLKLTPWQWFMMFHFLKDYKEKPETLDVMHACYSEKHWRDAETLKDFLNAAKAIYQMNLIGSGKSVKQSYLEAARMSFNLTKVDY
jgi:hypothetical protein